MTIHVDTSDLQRLVADLGEAADILPDVRGVVAKGALNIKQDWRRRWSGLAHAPAIPNAITYDTKLTPHSAEAEIGPDKSKRQGALGNLLEYGSIKNGPIPGGAPALAEETPKFEKALNDVAVKKLGRL
ncbi:MAG TPA: hypothetical protein VIP77_16205 [Jiangellaceae bacterium]